MLHTAIFFLVKLLSFFFTLSCLYLVCTVCWANFFTHTHNVGSCIDNKCFEITHRYIGQCRNNGKWTNVHREMCIRIRNYRWFTVTAIRWARSRSVCSACFALYHFWFVVGIAVAVTFFCCTSIRYLKRQKCIESSLAHFTHEHSHANSKHKNKPRIVNRSYAVA